MYTANELFFPHHIIPVLRSLRGEEWASLVDRIGQLPECHEEKLAFVLMMIKLNGCLSCETDSYRAMKGCAACAQQTLRRFKGDDDELLEIYRDALQDVQRYSSQGRSLAQLIQPNVMLVD